MFTRAETPFNNTLKQTFKYQVVCFSHHCLDEGWNQIVFGWNKLPKISIVFLFFNRGQRRKSLPEDFTIATETPDDPKKLTAVNLQLLKSLWLPDVEILNLKTFETLTVLSKLVNFPSITFDGNFPNLVVKKSFTISLVPYLLIWIVKILRIDQNSYVCKKFPRLLSRAY